MDSTHNQPDVYHFPSVVTDVSDDVVQFAHDKASSVRPSTIAPRQTSENRNGEITEMHLRPETVKELIRLAGGDITRLRHEGDLTFTIRK